jgi:aminopeptidase I
VCAPLTFHLTPLLTTDLDLAAKDILDFDLELYDTQPSTFLGLDSPPTLLSTARMDDKMCAFSAYQALLNTTRSPKFLSRSGDTAVVYLSDNEELGSNLRQGAKGNFLDSVLERVTEIFATAGDTEMTQSKVLYPPPPVDQTANASPKVLSASSLLRLRELRA